MTDLTIHAVADFALRADYLPAPVDALHLRAVDDPGQGAAHTTVEGHIVRLADDGRPTLVEFHAARRLLDRDGALSATLPDGRRLELDRQGLETLLAHESQNGDH
ncbi:MAG: hypothetical protein MSC31_03515 [Solirubrobacteraceae bacterium MAG38_C4-C5]|nr:hypothetical protein [Candidatus Siliceabacter maunaloa]